MSIVPPNQLRPDLLSVCSLQPFPGHISSPRTQMFASHLGQKLVVAGATERLCQTGMEAEFGKYTLNVKMPVDGRIIKIIDRHKKTIGAETINENPQTVVIYEDENTKEVGIINLTKFCSYHPYMGFEYKSQPGLSKIAPGQFIAKDTIFLDSPAITDTGGYAYGVNMNTALMSIPGVSEDGIIISQEALAKFKFKTYETRVVEWGSRYFPLNLYGTPENFKPFPEIGEYLRDDGILAMLRSNDKNLSIVEQSIYDLMEPDFIFDKATYVNGPGGRVVDIRVFHEDSATSPTPVGMEKQVEKYDLARKAFYTEILNEWRRLHRARGDALVITPDFNRLVVEAQSIINDPIKDKISKLYRREPLDDYRVEFVIEYEITPNIGFKLTGCHGKILVH